MTPYYAKSPAVMDSKNFLSLRGFLYLYIKLVFSTKNLFPTFHRT